MDNIKGTVINSHGYFVVILDGGNLNFEYFKFSNELNFWPSEYNIQDLKERGVGVYVVEDGELK